MAKTQDADLHKTLNSMMTKIILCKCLPEFPIMDIGSLYYCLMFFTFASPWSMELVFLSVQPALLVNFKVFLAFNAKATSNNENEFQ